MLQGFEKSGKCSKVKVASILVLFKFCKAHVAKIWNIFLRFIFQMLQKKTYADEALFEPFAYD